MAWNELTSAEKFSTGLGIGGLATGLIGTIYNGISSAIWNRRNYDQQQEQLNYQKWLNANQQQLQVADAQKAGLNPIAMNGGTVQAGSYSNVNPAQVDTAGLTSMTQSIIGMREAQEQRKTQIEIADKQAETAIRVAEINAQSQATQQINQEFWQSQENEKQRRAEKEIKDSDREANILIAKNNLNYKQAEFTRQLTYDTNKFNAQLQESFANAEYMSQKDYDDLQFKAWEIYKQWKYGLDIMGSGDMYTSMASWMTEKLGNFGESFMNLFRDEKKNANSKLSYDEFKTWFDSYWKKQKVTKTPDIETPGEVWKWEK